MDAHAQNPVAPDSGDPIKCTYEGCIFSTLQSVKLKKHTRRMHVMDDCSECGVLVKHYQLKRHLQSHRGERPQLVCTVAGCDQVFTTSQGLQGHVLRHSAPTIACTHEGCDQLFHSQSLLTKHVARRHVGGARPKSHLCAECGATFTLRCQLIAHAQKHALGRPFACDVAGCFYATKMRIGLINHKNAVHGATPTPCPECGKLLKSSGIARHIKLMHSHKPAAATFDCGQCGRSHSKAWLLRQHMLQHENARRFECDQCKKRFNTLLNMRLHLEVKHLSQKVICAECGDSFTSKLGLKSHQLRHTGERPYKCIYCDVMFRQQATCDKHKKTQHKEQYALEPKKRPRVKHL